MMFEIPRKRTQLKHGFMKETTQRPTDLKGGSRDRPDPPPSLLCCVPRKKQGTSSTSDAKFTESKDRVEAAFSKFDTDGNGYIDWDEFKEVELNCMAVILLDGGIGNEISI